MRQLLWLNYADSKTNPLRNLENGNIVCLLMGVI